MKIEFVNIATEYGTENTQHYSSDRAHREQLIQSIGTGKVVASFRVDKGHKNGTEIHQITENAIITVYNERTHRLVTKLIARTAQIYRYFIETNKEIDYNVICKAYEHEKKGYNMI